MSDFLRAEQADHIEPSEITNGTVDPNSGASEETTLPSEDTEPSVPEKFLKADGSVDHEKLLQSYLEMEKRQSTPQDEEPTDEVQEQTPEEKEKVQSILDAADLKMEDLQEQYDETGDLSEEAYQRFEDQGYPRSMVEMYVRGLQATTESGANLRELSYEAAGGSESYQEMVAWAADNLTEAEVEAYNAAVNSYNKDRTLKAVASLRAKYELDAPMEPSQTFTGTGAAKSNVYASEAEYMDDMMDPRYENSAAYRNKVIDKRMRSDF